MRTEPLFLCEPNQWVTFDELLWYWCNRLSDGGRLPDEDDRQRIGDALSWNDPDIVSEYYGRAGAFWSEHRQTIVATLRGLSNSWEQLRESREFRTVDGTPGIMYTHNDTGWHVTQFQGMWHVNDGSESYCSAELTDVENWIWRRSTL